MSRSKSIRATVIVERPEGIIIVSHSHHRKPTYMLPGGGIKKGERAIVGAKRELYEETGLHISKIVHIFDFATSYRRHKVFWAKTYGKLRKRHEITHIRFYNNSTKNKYKIVGNLEPILRKYENNKKLQTNTKEIKKNIKKNENGKARSKTKMSRSKFHKKRKHYKKSNYTQSVKKHDFLRAIVYKLRHIKISMTLIICLILMLLTAILQQFYSINIGFVNLPFIFYALEIVVIIYVIFWFTKKLDKINVDSNLSLFGLKLLSGALSGAGSIILVIFLLFEFSIIMLTSSLSLNSVKNFYNFIGLGDFFTIFTFGTDFGLQWMGTLAFLGLAVGMSFIGTYLLFKFKRETGQFIWFGRI